MQNTFSLSQKEKKKEKWFRPARALSAPRGPPLLGATLSFKKTIARTCVPQEWKSSPFHSHGGMEKSENRPFSLPPSPSVSSALPSLLRKKKNDIHTRLYISFFCLQFHQTLLTYMRNKVWEFHFYVANDWPEVPVCLHFPGMTLSVSTAFCPLRGSLPSR